jgi:hypothetical protein
LAAIGKEKAAIGPITKLPGTGEADCSDAALTLSNRGLAERPSRSVAAPRVSESKNAATSVTNSPQAAANNAKPKIRTTGGASALSTAIDAAVTALTPPHAAASKRM